LTASQQSPKKEGEEKGPGDEAQRNSRTKPEEENGIPREKRGTFGKKKTGKIAKKRRGTCYHGQVCLGDYNEKKKANLCSVV